MNFGTVLPFLMGGLKIRRKNFPNFVYHIEHVDDDITLISDNVHYTDCSGVISVMEIDDILANDWEVIKDV